MASLLALCVCSAVLRLRRPVTRPVAEDDSIYAVTSALISGLEREGVSTCLFAGCVAGTPATGVCAVPCPA